MFANPRWSPKNEFANLKLDFGLMKLADPLLINNHNSKVHNTGQVSQSLAKRVKKATRSLYTQEARTSGIPWFLSAKSFLKGERCNINFYTPTFPIKTHTHTNTFYIPNKTALAGKPSWAGQQRSDCISRSGHVRSKSRYMYGAGGQRCTTAGTKEGRPAQHLWRWSMEELYA